MTFQANCPDCKKTVTALPLLGGNDPRLALDSDEDVEVMHTTENGDHRWSLNKQEKENLRDAIWLIKAGSPWASR